MRCPHCRQVMPRPPINAGKRWTPAADRALCYQADALRRTGMSADAAIGILAQQFERNFNGIEARLTRFDRITPTP